MSNYRGIVISLTWRCHGPVRERGGDGGKKMFELGVRLETVTPLFLGGAEQNGYAELRPPSVKGALRFWHRALRALLCVAAVPRPIKLIDPTHPDGHAVPVAAQQTGCACAYVRETRCRSIYRGSATHRRLGRG